jgi:hypothetical protein
MRPFARLAALTALFLTGANINIAAAADAPAIPVELEAPLAAPRPLRGLLRLPNRTGTSPAIVLLLSCNGNWRRLDERWGRVIASWGYVTLAVDSSLKSNCRNAEVYLALDAYRALNFLVQQPAVDPVRVAALGFSQGGWIALSSVERGTIERTATNKFRAAIPSIRHAASSGRYDSADDTGRRTRRLGDRERVPQSGGRARRLRHIP